MTSKDNNDLAHELEYLFDKQYLIKSQHIEISHDLKGTINSFNHSFNVSSNFGMSYTAHELLISVMADQLIFTKKFYSGDIFSKIVHHSNGKRYLIFGTGIFDFITFDLTNRCEILNKKFTNVFELYRVTEFLYNKTNNLMVINGCDSMNSNTSLVFDFSLPEKAPYILKDLGYFSDGCCKTVNLLEYEITLGIGEDDYYEKMIPTNEIFEYLSK